MLITGNFINKEGRTVSVRLVSSGNTDKALEIGDEASGLFFSSDDTVTTESGFNDSMDVIIGQSASVNLQTENFAPSLSGRSFRDVAVEISLDGVPVFTGFLEPNTYSQPYVDTVDDLSLNCIDVLSALEYCPYGGVGVSKTYENALRDAGTRTFRQILDSALSYVAGSFSKEFPLSVYYDLSRSLPGSNPQSVFDDLSISEMAILGDDEDDVMTYKDVVEALLKYLNLHIVQYGRALYIFSWETIRKGNTSWYDMKLGTTLAMSKDNGTEQLTNDIAGDTDGELNVSEAFNKLSLKVSLKSLDELVSSPLDNLESVYPKRMRFCTEIRAHYASTFSKALRKDVDLLELYSKGEVPDLCWQEWYLLVKRNPDWIIGRGQVDLADTFKTNDQDQQNIVNQMLLTPAACLMSLGCVSYNTENADDAKKDNSPKSSLDMSDYLVISVFAPENGDMPHDSFFVPLAQYVGNNGGAVLSPPDHNSYNYIVISGTMRLQGKDMQSPIVYGYKNAPIGMEREAVDNGAREPNNLGGGSSGVDFAIVSQQEGKHLRFLAYRWRKNPPGNRVFGSMAIEDLNPKNIDAHPVGWPSEIKGYYSNGVVPPSQLTPASHEYAYSQVGDNSDRLSKVPVLECMLVIGDQSKRSTEDGCAKVLVEDMSQNGDINALKWKKFKPMSECRANHPGDTDAAEDEFYAQTFAIGFDPKIGDHLINEDHDIQTNFTWELGIDTDKGMAIPIRHSDHLSGKVDFQILGVVNSFYYHNITRRHRTWFRKEKWHDDASPLMASVRNIFIKDFSIKLYSDNAMEGNEGDNNGDLVYTSDTDETFYNKKDDLEFKFHSAFTTEECAAQGLSPVIAITTVTETASGDGCLQIKDNVTDEAAKAEQLYVSSYYEEMHLSRVSLSQSLRDIRIDNAPVVSPWKLYHSDAADKDFFVQSIERNLMEGTATVTMEEVF